jgi:hypothetical protein
MQWPKHGTVPTHTPIICKVFDNLHMLWMGGVVQAWVGQKLLQHNILRVLTMSDLFNI